MNRFFGIILLAVILSSCSNSEKPPNFVFILVDDLGWADVKCNNPPSFYDTPNIDKLAATGVRFTQFYNCARCCPSRASLLTGQYPHKAGINGMGVNLNRSVIQLLPWTEGYEKALTENYTVLFSTGRLPERELLFKWAGPIAEDRYVLLAKKDRNIGILNEEKLNWDEKVVKYPPSLKLYDPYVTASFTVRDLLTHRSGLRGVSGGMLMYHSDYSRTDIIERMQ